MNRLLAIISVLFFVVLFGIVIGNHNMADSRSKHANHRALPYSVSSLQANINEKVKPVFRNFSLFLQFEFTANNFRMPVGKLLKVPINNANSCQNRRNRMELHVMIYSPRQFIGTPSPPDDPYILS